MAKSRQRSWYGCQEQRRYSLLLLNSLWDSLLSTVLVVRLVGLSTESASVFRNIKIRELTSADVVPWCRILLFPSDRVCPDRDV
jgi:hypothetical protein